MPDDEVECVVLVRDGLGVGDAAVDRQSEVLGIAQRDLHHARGQVGDRTGLRDAALHEVEEEEAGAAAQFECPLVRQRLVAGDGVETPACVVDAALVVRDRPLVVVGLRFPVVVQDLGELGVLQRSLDLFGRGVRVGRGICRACSHAGNPTEW